MDGALQMKKINKNGAIVSEATSRISAGVWGQTAARNNLSIGKHICHICLAGETKTQTALFARYNSIRSGDAKCLYISDFLQERLMFHFFR